MSDQTRTLIERAQQAQRERRFADARSAWISAIELLRRENTELELAGALRSLGEVERKLHDRDAARRHYEESVALYRRLNEPIAFAHTLRHLGDVYREAALPDMAEPCYREALDIYHRHPETAPLDLANAIRSFAVLKTAQGENQEAIGLWEQARRLYADMQVDAGITESSEQLARLAAGSAG